MATCYDLGINEGGHLPLWLTLPFALAELPPQEAVPAGTHLPSATIHVEYLFQKNPAKLFQPRSCQSARFASAKLPLQA
eukprot:1161163-Pelagomonas_calceolata.AAC.16